MALPRTHNVLMTQAARHWEAALLLAIVVLGGCLRFYQLDHLPPGLYADEAFYALDALDVQAGARPIYFPANNGREPLFIYLLAASVTAFGRTPLAVRFPAAVLGTLDIVAAYALGRALFGRRVGLMAAALTAGSLWALALSRIGLRAATLPPLAALMLACAAHGWRTRRRWLIALAGALCGLCFYTYLAARLIPLPLIAFGIFWYSARAVRGAMRGEKPGGPAVGLARDLSAFIVPAALVAAPLALYAISEPQIYLGRVEQVSIFGAGLAPGAATLLNNLGAVVGMFVWHGDLNARHNVPGRPVFDPVLGVAFYAGVALALHRVWKRRDGAAALALLWTGALLIPTVFSQDAPHFLRAIGVLPMVFMFPALALEAVWGRAAARSRPAGWLAAGLIAALLAAHGTRTALDYFGPYARDPNTALYFQSAAAELARRANAYVAGGGRTLFLDRRLWEAFPAVRFLLQPSPAVRVFAGDEAPAPADTAEAAVFIWPHTGRPAEAVAWLPEPARVTAGPGALYRNDREAEAYPLWAAYSAEPLRPAGEPLAEFEAGGGRRIILRAADVLNVEPGWRVALTWSADGPLDDDLHVFVHLRAEDVLLDQADGPLGGALYPVRAWRPGDWVSETAMLDRPADAEPGGLQIVVGLYRYPSGDRLLVSGTGADAVRLKAPGP